MGRILEMLILPILFISVVPGQPVLHRTDNGWPRKAYAPYFQEGSSGLDEVAASAPGFFRVFSESDSGFRLKLGDMIDRSGFALGPEYLRRDLAGGRLMLRASARGSVSRYQLHDFQIGAPSLGGGRYFVDFYAAYRNYPKMGYYGPGPSSSKTNRTTYRLEDTSADIAFGIAPARRLKAGLRAGYLMVNTGPGEDSRFPPIQTMFAPSAAPGVDRQTDFLRSGAFLLYDSRDNPYGARRGGYYGADYLFYSDRKLGLHSFHRFTGEARRYIPLFNERRVVAMRAKSVFTHPSADQRVPFYLQPSLGGSDSLRGYPAFRFYDNHLMLFTAEWRWEVSSGLDMAIFADTGKVFARPSQWNLTDLEHSYGVGLRFNFVNKVFVRTDIGFSREGSQVWLRFGDSF